MNEETINSIEKKIPYIERNCHDWETPWVQVVSIYMSYNIIKLCDKCAPPPSSFIDQLYFKARKRVFKVWYKFCAIGVVYYEMIRMCKIVFV